MCILYFSAKTKPKPNEYALILINNRDELYDRPTKVSHFWSECPNVIGGRDATVGKEGGTWLGMSKNGKIGILLNVLQPSWEEKPEAKGRGSLVSDFVCKAISSEAYLNGVAAERHLYNNFNLVTIETRPGFHEFIIGHYNNLSDQPPCFLQSGIHGLGNCLPENPWKKIPYGLEKFTKIVEEHPTVETKVKLEKSLIELLNDDTRHFPDPQLEKQGQGKGNVMLEPLSALCVKIPERKYGTRTNTIILVDGLGMAEYIERTMEEPVDALNPNWIINRHKFALDGFESKI